MAFEKFQDANFKKRSLALIEKCNVVIADYQAQGFTLTLRQLYYQMVARGIIPNKYTEYKNLGELLKNARLTGLVDWNAIEDRTRNVEHPNTWRQPQDVLRAVADQYKENPWLEQDFHVEVWIEKDALIGVIEGVCDRYRVPYFACRGNVSVSEVYHSGKRLADIQRRQRRQPVILHLGDHDPSGLDMTRDNDERLAMFARSNGLILKRLALNMDQIEQYDPPPNPAKQTDSRYTKYAEEFGESSWELDALEPVVISDLIEDAIEEYKDDDKWKVTIDREDERKKALSRTYEFWPKVVAYVNDLDANREDDDPDA